MCRTKALPRNIAQMDFLTKQETLTYLNVSDEVFKEEWKPYLNIYDNGGKGPMFKKQQIKDFMEYRKAIQGRPFEDWRHKAKI
jgi:hypothetical protein